jgi:hypothetical protein
VCAQGYGAFSAGISQVQKTLRYIQQQRERHRAPTFQEKYISFLKNMAHIFDEKYIANERRPTRSLGIWDSFAQSYSTLRDGSLDGRFPDNLGDELLRS